MELAILLVVLFAIIVVATGTFAGFRKEPDRREPRSPNTPYAPSASRRRVSNGGYRPRASTPPATSSNDDLMTNFLMYQMMFGNHGQSDTNGHHHDAPSVDHGSSHSHDSGSSYDHGSHDSGGGYDSGSSGDCGGGDCGGGGE